MKSTRKYLARYAEPETALAHELFLTTAKRHNWQHCLVIPAYKESEDFYQRLVATLLQQQDVLLIVVLNQPDKLANTHPENTRLWQHLIEQTHQRQVLNNLHLRDIPDTNSALLLVNRFSPEQTIPEKQGVGLARKIGADIALSLIDKQYVEAPWIYTSDADAHLPSSYFTALKKMTDATGKTPYAAAIYPFRHLCDDSPIGRATRLYEQSMQQYVAGLHSAGSPYAFQTIGSTIAISSHHYAQVRGFPKRSGGEDFYLLNKLAKTGAINNLQAPEIFIEARQSNRVPFGTGPAINKLLLKQNLYSAPIFYHPSVFTELKSWLSAIPVSQKTAFGDLPLASATVQALLAIGVVQAIEAAHKVCSSTQSYNRHINTWFDGFKTLKFIHHLREHSYPSIDITALKKYTIATTNTLPPPP